MKPRLYQRTGKFQVALHGVRRVVTETPGGHTEPKAIFHAYQCAAAIGMFALRIAADKKADIGEIIRMIWLQKTAGVRKIAVDV